MKNSVKTLLVCGFASAMTLTTVVGQIPVTITVDESGNGTLGAPFNSIFSGVPNVLDPVSGQSTLRYPGFNNFPSLAGDVVLLEGGTQPSDLIRFDGTGGIYFFSLLDGASDGVADVPVLPTPSPGAVVLNEIGPEGNNGLVYAPQAGQPGFIPALTSFGAFVVYNIKSDAPVVPEPGTLALFGLAGGLLALFWRQRSGRA